eukprot:m.28964 g.28964  ORF g.28964 m.28964 type:complete len:570 (+) comp8052_c0_seq1:108-1817(+)
MPSSLSPDCEAFAIRLASRIQETPLGAIFTTEDGGTDGINTVKIIKHAVSAVKSETLRQSLLEHNDEVHEKIIELLTDMKQDDKVKDIQSRLNEAETCAPEKALKIYEALLPTLPFEEKSAEVVTRYIEIKKSQGSWNTDDVLELLNKLYANALFPNAHPRCLVLLMDVLINHAQDERSKLPLGEWERALCFLQFSVYGKDVSSISWNGEGFQDYMAALLSRYFDEVVAFNKQSPTSNSDDGEDFFNKCDKEAKELCSRVRGLLHQSPSYILDSLIQAQSFSTEPPANKRGRLLQLCLYQHLYGGIQETLSWHHLPKSSDLYIKIMLLQRKIKILGKQTGRTIDSQIFAAWDESDMNKLELRALLVKARFAESIVEKFERGLISFWGILWAAQEEECSSLYEVIVNDTSDTLQNHQESKDALFFVDTTGVGQPNTVTSHKDEPNEVDTDTKEAVEEESFSFVSRLLEGLDAQAKDITEESNEQEEKKTKKNSKAGRSKRSLSNSQQTKPKTRKTDGRPKTSHTEASSPNVKSQPESSPPSTPTAQTAVALPDSVRKSARKRKIVKPFEP